MIDLHSHTDESDGTFTPQQLVAEAKRVGLNALAVTDHDTFAGYDLAVPFARDAGLELICGIELSTCFHGKSLHLLGYFVNHAPSAEFRAWLDSLKASRQDRNNRLAEKLRSLGVEITMEEVERKGKSLAGRPHFAQVMVEKGYSNTVQHAFEEYLDESARGYVEREEIPVAEAIDRVRAAGGVTSMAHPVRVAKNHWETLATYIAELAELGMSAVEVQHSDHSPENVSYYSTLAVKHGLGMTGGSDFHGGNKPSISLGTGKHNNLHVDDSVLVNLRKLS